MADLLDQIVIDGLNHNQPFLSALMNHPRWRRGELSTAFIDEEYNNGFKQLEPEIKQMSRLAMVAMSVALKRRAGTAGLAGQLSPAPSGGQEDWVVAIDATTVPLTVLAARSASQIDVDMLAPAFDSPARVTGDWRPGEPVWAGTIGGAPIAVQLRSVTGGVRLMYQRRRCRGAGDDVESCRSFYPDAGEGGG